jgi:hypothetical protein
MLLIILIVGIILWSTNRTGNAPVKKSNLSPVSIGETINQSLKPIIANTNNGLQALSFKLDTLSSKLDKQNSQLIEKDTKIKEQDAKIKQFDLKIKEQDDVIMDRDAVIRSSETNLENLEKAQNKAIDSLKSDHEQLLKQVHENHVRYSQKTLDIIDKNKEIHLPVFIKSLLQEDFEKLYTDVLLNHPEAISLWTSLGSFKSSCNHDASTDFTLQILKQLGLDVFRYFATYTDSNPQFTHEKLSKWAECLNTNSNDRFSLFIPALGASINNALMQSTSGSAYTVTEVLGWGIRNPNGIVYSTALFR